MYEVREGRKIINGVTVKTFERDVREGDTVLEVEAGTTGYCGGGRERGGRTYLRIMDSGRGDLFIRLSAGSDKKADGFEICFSGDDGLNALLKAVSFAWDTFEDQRRGIDG